MGFKVGDRVAIYGHRSQEDKVQSRYGTVTDVTDFLILVNIGNERHLLLVRSGKVVANRKNIWRKSWAKNR